MQCSQVIPFCQYLPENQSAHSNSSSLMWKQKLKKCQTCQQYIGETTCPLGIWWKDHQTQKSSLIYEYCSIMRSILSILDHQWTSNDHVSSNMITSSSRKIYIVWIWRKLFVCLDTHKKNKRGNFNCNETELVLYSSRDFSYRRLLCVPVSLLGAIWDTRRRGGKWGRRTTRRWL